MLSKQEQELLVRSADQDPLMREAIEVLTGRKWDELNFGQRLVAVAQELEKARGTALMAASLRSRQDLRKIIDDVTEQVGASEKLERTESELQVTKTRLTEAEQRIADLTTAAASLPPRSLA